MTMCSLASGPRLRLVLLCVIAQGCGSEGRTLSLDKGQARIACQEFLNAWQAGEKSDSLQPEIYGKDTAWDAGLKLAAFELLPNQRDGGSNLHIPVRLTLKNAQGRESQVDVVYIVGTTPQVSVFREGID